MEGCVRSSAPAAGSEAASAPGSRGLPAVEPVGLIEMPMPPPLRQLCLGVNVTSLRIAAPCAPRVTAGCPRSAPGTGSGFCPVAAPWEDVPGRGAVLRGRGKPPVTWQGQTGALAALRGPRMGSRARGGHFCVLLAPRGWAPPGHRSDLAWCWFVTGHRARVPAWRQGGLSLGSPRVPTRFSAVAIAAVELGSAPRRGLGQSRADVPHPGKAPGSRCPPLLFPEPTAGARDGPP